MSENDESYYEYAMRIATMHETYFEERVLAPERLAALRARAEESLETTRTLESGETEPFDRFLARYFAG